MQKISKLTQNLHLSVRDNELDQNSADYDKL